MSSVWRQRKSVNSVQHFFLYAAGNRHSIQRRIGIFIVFEVDIKPAAVGREGEIVIPRVFRRRTQRQMIAAVNKAEPQTAPTGIVDDIGKSFPVGRERGDGNFAVRRQLFDVRLGEGKIGGIVCPCGLPPKINAAEDKAKGKR